MKLPEQCPDKRSSLTRAPFHDIYRALPTPVKEFKMATYASGKQTRDILIDAAGELAAELGFSNVSIRAVAEKAEQNIGSIHYHFKSKEKLFEAVIHRATRKKKEQLLSGILEIYEAQLDSPHIQAMVLRQIVHGEIQETFDPDKPWWHCRVIYQTMKSQDSLYDLLYNEIILPDINALQRLLKRIKPELDKETIFIKTMLMMTPIIFHAENADNILRIMKTPRYSDSYLKKLEDTIVRQAQQDLGLPLENVS